MKPKAKIAELTPEQRLEDIDRRLRNATLNYQAWVRGDIKAFDPIKCRIHMDDLLEQRFDIKHPNATPRNTEDSASYLEWGAGGYEGMGV